MSSSSSWVDRGECILYMWVRVVKFCVTYTLTNGTCRLVLARRRDEGDRVGKECRRIGERKWVGGFRPRGGGDRWEGKNEKGNRVRLPNSIIIIMVYTYVYIPIYFCNPTRAQRTKTKAIYFTSDTTRGAPRLCDIIFF